MTPLTPSADAIRTLVLVDGEHHPDVLRSAVARLVETGLDIVGAALLGGTEKLEPDETPDVGVSPVVTGPSPLAALLAALDRFGPDLVFDLSDDPVVNPRSRLLLASHALARGATYRGADFTFEPPPRPRVATKPTIAVVATGKRTGKTAVTAEAARVLAAGGRSPVIVAMGRGGPEEPELIDPAVHPLTPEALLSLADGGRHGASDHLEGALMAGVATVGTRRAGGGLAGAPAVDNVVAGIELANRRPEPLIVLDGSGAAVPPVHADATVCLVPAGVDPELATGYLNPYRLLLADLVVVTLVDESLAGVPATRVYGALEDRVRELVPGVPVVRITFRPHPTEPISGRSVFFATTAPPTVAKELVTQLEEQHGARVVGLSSNLANRSKLHEDLQAAGGAEVLVTELKAGAVDMATRVALDGGMSVVYCDNRPVTTGGDGDLVQHIQRMADLAVARFEARRGRPHPRNEQR